MDYIFFLKHLCHNIREGLQLEQVGGNMKHIIMIKDMNCEHCATKIAKALEDAHIAADINLTNKTIAVEKDGDIVANAKRIISALGYTIL